MHRNVLIIISVLFICLGFGLLAVDRLPFTQFTELTADASGRQFAAAICLKVGMALGAVWLAVPERLDQLKWDQILRPGRRFSAVLNTATKKETPFSLIMCLIQKSITSSRVNRYSKRKLQDRSRIKVSTLHHVKLTPFIIRLTPRYPHSSPIKLTFFIDSCRHYSVGI